MQCFCAGDRILAVNGKSLEYVNHDEAVQALKNTPVDVELLVSQSTRTDNDIGKKRLPSDKKIFIARCERIFQTIIQVLLYFCAATLC